jgi:hypothetical protein
VVVRRISYGSSSMQVLSLAPSSEGAPTVNSVMGLDNGDDSEYIPH